MDVGSILFAISVLPSFALATATCCQTLTSILGSRVLYPNSTAYETSVDSYWSQQEQLINPSCVLSATSAEDVSKALRVLVPNACKFAVRSGGHGAIAGIANIQDGVTIDLSALNWIVPSADRSLVSVGPGQRWGGVYAALDRIGVSVPGGRDSPVGVGGTTLGGGFGYFATEAGFACDNVVEFQVVLANGRIVNATKDNEHDLWLALKGGANNFGIVTNFVFRTFPLGQVWAGDIYYPVSTLDQQLDAFYRFTSDPNYDVKAGLIHNFAFTPATGPILTNLLAYASPEENPAPFRPFTSIQPQMMASTKVMTLEALAAEGGSLSPNSRQQLTFAVTFENNLDLLRQVFDIWNASTADVSAIPSIQWTISIEPIVPAIACQSAIKGGNVLGLNVPQQGLVLALLSATFNHSQEYPIVSAAAEKLSNNIISAAKAACAYNPYIDLNHAAPWQDPIASYGDKIQAFLRRTAKKYDPQGVFQRLCPGGFKVN
ncbi:uncharacterized FAD-linked oxidoreductase YgaK [Aspergillus lentulus]|uniref:Uncharacterized FAD-linked oxidoreductase YgaK n=1 Tax=Aspergillus lentulus TaxID=293939 RepID=A0ABQ0ZX95_ASPLE|nr:uncharacterized FAD-linked oxidoreductase YgaK [Aspergillus lentulus]GFG05537.1 uncharacterized FAD-linked oxidoreductase YgaK [Aspergillus lentulus]